MSRKWTIQDLQKLADKGVKVEGMQPAQKKQKTKRKEAKALQEMKQTLQLLKVPFVPEHRFHEYRKFRFDIAFPEKMVAIEYEGINSRKSGHTTVTGYTKDAEKYNLAQVMGWTVLRYTMKNYKNYLSDLKQLEVI